MVHTIEGTHITKKELILCLLKADMRNVKLIYGLESAGALVEDFYADLSCTILKLIGFNEAERTDDLYRFYDTLMNRLNSCACGCVYRAVELPCS
jgi:hypothetical protein